MKEKNGKIVFTDYLGLFPLIFTVLFLFGTLIIIFRAVTSVEKLEVAGIVTPILFCLVAAFLCVPFSAWRTLTIDRTSRRVIYAYRTAFSGKTSVLEFSRIRSVKFILNTPYPASRKYSSSHIIFKQDDGKDFDLPNVVWRAEDAKKIAEIIGVPFRASV